MTPEEYIIQLKIQGFRNDIVNHVLTVKEKEDARQVLESGFDLIGRKMGEIFDDMTPKAVNHINLLQQFLLVFIEHAMNPALVRRAERSIVSDQ